MNLTLNTWEWLSVIGGLVGSLALMLLGLGRLLIIQVEKRLDLRFQALEIHREQASLQWRDKFSSLDYTVRANEQRLTQLLCDLPLQYQRREDSIRQEVAIIHRLDALAGKVEQALRCDARACPLRDAHHPDLPGTP